MPPDGEVMSRDITDDFRFARAILGDYTRLADLVRYILDTAPDIESWLPAAKAKELRELVGDKKCKTS